MPALGVHVAEALGAARRQIPDRAVRADHDDVAAFDLAIKHALSGGLFTAAGGDDTEALLTEGDRNELRDARLVIGDAALLLKRAPWRDVGVMIQLGNDNFVAPLVTAAKGPREMKRERRHIRAEGDFAAKQRAVDDVAFLRAVVARRLSRFQPSANL